MLLISCLKRPLGPVGIGDNNEQYDIENLQKQILIEAKLFFLILLWKVPFASQA